MSLQERLDLENQHEWRVAEIQERALAKRGKTSTVRMAEVWVAPACDIPFPCGACDVTFEEDRISWYPAEWGSGLITLWSGPPFRNTFRHTVPDSDVQLLLDPATVINLKIDRGAKSMEFTIRNYQVRSSERPPTAYEKLHPEATVHMLYPGDRDWQPVVRSSRSYQGRVSLSKP